MLFSRKRSALLMIDTKLRHSASAGVASNFIGFALGAAHAVGLCAAVQACRSYMCAGLEPLFLSRYSRSFVREGPAANFGEIEWQIQLITASTNQMSDGIAIATRNRTPAVAPVATMLRMLAAIIQHHRAGRQQ
jgi:hypothetical protein